MGPTGPASSPHPQTDPDSSRDEAFIPVDAAIAGRSLSYVGQGNPGTLCGLHRGLPQVYFCSLHVGFEEYKNKIKTASKYKLLRPQKPVKYLSVLSRFNYDALRYNITICKQRETISKTGNNVRVKWIIK